MFVHDFDYSDPKVDFEKVKEKYNRRINRLKKQIRKSKKILFVHAQSGEANVDNLMEILNSLQKLYPNKQIKILYIHLVKQKKGYEYRYKSEMLDIVDMEFGTNTDPSEDWIGNRSVFRDLFSNYDHTWRRKVSFWWKRVKSKYSLSKLFQKKV